MKLPYVLRHPKKWLELDQKLEKIRFRFTLLRKKPYFGSHMAAGQTNPARAIAMEKFLKFVIAQHRQKNSGARFNMIEVGSWAGNSVQVWGKVLKNSSLKSWNLYCVDPWQYYPDYFQKDDGVTYDSMKKALTNDAIYDLFMHNVKCFGLGEQLVPVRDSSTTFLPLLADNSFDIAYIDGNHAYDYFSADLANAMRLVKNGGYICGDDLEYQVPDIDVEYAEAHKNMDCIRCPKANTHYHPGIALSVWEKFGRKIPTSSGFWVVQKVGSEFQSVDVDTLTVA